MAVRAMPAPHRRRGFIGRNTVALCDASRSALMRFGVGGLLAPANRFVQAGARLLTFSFSTTMGFNRRTACLRSRHGMRRKGTAGASTARRADRVLESNGA